MTRTLIYLFLAYSHGVIKASASYVPPPCQTSRDGFTNSENTYENSIVALQVSSSPATLPVANQWLSYDPESAYPDVLNFTLTTNASAAALFSVKYQPAYQSPKSGGWSCAWWQFIPPNGTATGFGSDISVAVLNYDPPRTLFPLLMTSWAGLHAHVSGWNVFAYGYTVLDNGTDTMVLHDGVKHNGSFVAYNDGNSSKTFVGFTESLDVLATPITLRVVSIRNTPL